MVTVREWLEQILFEEITVLNGENTEEDLNMEIARELMNDKIEKVDALVMKTFETEMDNNEVKPNGAWLYAGGLVDELIFERYDTIASAIKAAVSLINAKIICDGNIVTYDILNDNEAYYVDDTVGKVKIVSLCA